MRNKWLMRKPGVLAVMLACMLVFMTACGSNGKEEEQTAEDGRMRVVTSIYPIYYLATEIGGEHADVVNLIPTGVEPHDWSPRSGDLSTASKAELLLYHGVGLEGWIDGFLKGLSSDSKLIAKEMSAGITLISGSEEEAASAADEHEHDHDHSQEAGEHGHEHEEAEAEEGHGHSHDTDPHTWVSPKSLLIIAENVKNALVEADADHAAQYEANYKAVSEKLASLDERYTKELNAVPNKNIVVSHQAFGYLARGYGLKQVSIMGLSADAEPRAQDLLKIAKFVKENGIKYIFFEELVSDELARTLASEAKAETLVLNPLEGLTPSQEKSGEDLISLLEVNLQNLLQALQ